MEARMRGRARRGVRWMAVALGAGLLTGCSFFARPSPTHVSPSRPGKAAQRRQAPQKAGPSPLGGALAVVVDNSPPAHPESGVGEADLVFEAPAEGGITRLLAVYWHRTREAIGPVRSTRIYFDRLAHMYGLPLAHAGGNVDALDAIPALHIENLDQIYGAAPYFWRSAARSAPYNLFTSVPDLLAGVRRKGFTLPPPPSFPGSGSWTGRPATAMTITWADDPGVFVYRVTWRWDGRHYVREENGIPERGAGGHSITAKRVVVLVTPARPDPDPYTPGAIALRLTGEGQGWVLSGGKVTEVQWRRRSGHGFTLWKGGKEIGVHAEHVWVELVPGAAMVHFSS